MKYGHFIEMDASQNVNVNRCTFTGYKASKRHTSEAINLDTPDKKTRGFTHGWSQYDCTPNQNVQITNCIFSNLEKAIGTHQYSVEKYHTDISISDCMIKNCVSGGIEMMNWQRVSLTNTRFMNIGKTVKENILPITGIVRSEQSWCEEVFQRLISRIVRFRIFQELCSVCHGRTRILQRNIQ